MNLILNWDQSSISLFDCSLACNVQLVQLWMNDLSRLLLQSSCLNDSSLPSYLRWSPSTWRIPILCWYSELMEDSVLLRIRRLIMSLRIPETYGEYQIHQIHALWFRLSITTVLYFYLGSQQLPTFFPVPGLSINN